MDRRSPADAAVGPTPDEILARLRELDARRAQLAREWERAACEMRVLDRAIAALDHDRLALNRAWQEHLARAEGSPSPPGRESG